MSLPMVSSLQTINPQTSVVSGSRAKSTNCFSWTEMKKNDSILSILYPNFALHSRDVVLTLNDSKSTNMAIYPTDRYFVTDFEIL